MDMEEVEKIIKEGKAEDKMPRSKKKIEIEDKEFVNPPTKKRDWTGKEPALYFPSTNEILPMETPKAKGKLMPMKTGGKVKMKSASSRADGIAKRGKTRGKFV
jgi:hypothetical protein